MDYQIEVFDPWGRRRARIYDSPLLEVTRTTPDAADLIRGLLPAEIEELAPGWRIRVFVDDRLFCDATVSRILPQWSDVKKLILDRYVDFHETLAFEAQTPARTGDAIVRRAYTNRAIGDIVKDLINAAPGRVHYTVAHDGYPDGAVREYGKFLSRMTVDNELGLGGIATGQWVGGARIDATAAYAVDGDTIRGVVVDGIEWPDIRLAMIDAEELARNSHALERHPETEFWTDAEYAQSGYCVRANDSRNALEHLLGAQGIDYIELNAHRDANGLFDDRVDADGRYIALVYGGGQCLNAAMVEQGHADVYLYADGRYLVPELALKEFYSYDGPHVDTIEDVATVVSSFDAAAGLFEALTALAYAAHRGIWSVGPDLEVSFGRAVQPDLVWYWDSLETGVMFGSDLGSVVNAIHFEGNPLSGLTLSKLYERVESQMAYGRRQRDLEYFALALESDSDRLVGGILDDVAYPMPAARVQYYRGHGTIAVGDLIELRGGPLTRLDSALPGEWGDAFAGKMVGRAQTVTHRFTGRHVFTEIELTSPLRSVGNPIGFLVSGQPPKEALFQFRLDDPSVGADLGYHLD